MQKTKKKDTCKKCKLYELVNCFNCNKEFCVGCTDIYYQYPCSLFDVDCLNYDGFLCSACYEISDNENANDLFKMYFLMKKVRDDFFALRKKYKKIAECLQQEIMRVIDEKNK